MRVRILGRLARGAEAAGIADCVESGCRQGEGRNGASYAAIMPPMAKKPEKSKRGRPTEYNPKYHDPWVRSLARRGMTGKEIALELGVDESTIYRWCDRYPEFCKSLNEGRSYADAMVEDSLYRRALGGTYTEKRQSLKPNSKGEQVKVMEAIEREVPPDVSACIFWLKNRDPEHWRDKREYVPYIEEEQQEDELSRSLRELAEEMDANG